MVMGTGSGTGTGMGTGSDMGTVTGTGTETEAGIGVGIGMRGSQGRPGGALVSSQGRVWWGRGVFSLRALLGATRGSLWAQKLGVWES